MQLLLNLHIASDFVDSNLNCVQVYLDDKLIKRIHQLSKRASKHGTSTEFEYSPSLGTTSLDIENLNIINVEELKDQQNIFTEDLTARVDVIELNVDKTHFWWSGMFKHTDIHWETRQVPLEMLPQSAPESVRKPDLEMTAEQMNAVHEKIASGIAHGLNAREIEATFNRHITKAQLIRCMMELLERNH